MKAIINGKRYDTEKAILIGESSHGSGRDFSMWRAGLYRTPRSGAFFLAGRGGPMSMFSRKTGQNEWTGGDGILPLSLEDAREWAEQHLSTEEVEKGFAASIEDA